MWRSQKLRLRGTIVAVCLGIAAPVAAYYGVVQSRWDQIGCQQPQACIVQNAEVDDAETVTARHVVGRGPSFGYLADRRLANDVVQVGQLFNGVKVYSFKYIFEDTARVGLIAQDLVEYPDMRLAVLTMSNGLLGIDYAALGLRPATLSQWNSSGLGALRADFNLKLLRAPKTEQAVTLRNTSASY